MAGALEKKLSEAGYSLLGEEKIDELILAILKSGNNRFLKAIPYLIYLHEPDIESIYRKTKNKKLFGALLATTKKIFAAEKIARQIPSFGGKINKDYDDFKQEFILQRTRAEGRDLLLNKEKIYAERSLQMQLSQIFTQKEKQIISDVLSQERITKTEYEYYSRKTKKKLNAIIGLREFAQSLLAASPKKE